MYQKILMPVDDSETSSRALSEATRFCCEQHGKVRLVHIVDMAQFSWSGTEFVDVGDLQQNLRENGKKVLERSLASLKEAGLEVESALIEIWGGNLSSAIIDDAKAWGADLVIMGSHGWTGLDHLLLGSVAEGVVRHATLPVLIIPMKR
ncbi:universal stress protein [Burkholderiaceae bacterium DAT-1]|nr:universal stress protein [Burkholderiaceae bacterium DAT-1]